MKIVKPGVQCPTAAAGVGAFVLSGMRVDMCAACDYIASAHVFGGRSLRNAIVR